jgi:site-specific recombinase XerD
MRDHCTSLRDLAIIDLLASAGMRVGEAYVKQKLKKGEIFFSDLDFKTAPPKSEVRFCC